MINREDRNLKDFHEIKADLSYNLFDDLEDPTKELYFF